VIFSTDGGNEWEKSRTGLQGLDVASLACLGGVVVAVTRGYGAFRSTDGGKTWILPKKYRFIEPEDDPGLGSLLVDSCGTYYLVAGHWWGSVVRSRDGGETWIRACNADFGRVGCLVIHPNSSIIAGTANGVFISNDSGDSWSRADTMSSWDLAVRELDVAGNGMVFGRTGEAVLRSSDGGSSWEYASKKTMITCLCAGSDSCVYIGTAKEGVLGSRDCGTTWRRMTDSLYISSLDADRVGNVYAVSYEHGILGSTDRGETWKPIRVGTPYAIYRVLAAPGGEMALILDDEGTLYESVDCFTTWKTIATPYRVSSMSLSPDGRLFISEDDDPALHRSREPLFDVAAPASLFRHR
jgi:photosystem II stability/assembly factor-like uncharacterized protein